MWSTPDLSEITLIVVGLLNEAVANSTLPNASLIKVSPSSPETLRHSPEQCHLTLYLLHIGRDPFWRNTPLAGPRPQLNNNQPLSLNLSYLLSAFYEKDAVLEQRAMSIALQAIQSNPIMNSQTVPSTANGPDWSQLPSGDFVISIEADTIEEMSRLWQAFTVPIRLSALIKVSVIFLANPITIPPPAPTPETVNLAVAPFADDPTLPNALPALVPGYAQQTPPVPDGSNLAQLQAGIGPLVAVGGVPAAVPGTTVPLLPGYLVIEGSALDLADAAEVYLSAPGSGVWWDITSWRQVLPENIPPGGRLILAPPQDYAAPAGSPLTATPLPGLYLLAVGRGGVPVSNQITIAIAPRVDGLTNPPILKVGAGKIFTVTGAGFLPAAGVALSLGTSNLGLSSAANPAVGKFVVDAAGTSIRFKAPTALAAGTYPLLLSVNGVAAAISWLAVVT